LILFIIIIKSKKITVRTEDYNNVLFLNKVWAGWAKSGFKAFGDYFVVSRRQKLLINSFTKSRDKPSEVCSKPNNSLRRLCKRGRQQVCSKNVMVETHLKNRPPRLSIWSGLA
jgi:hypothetical protein